MMIVRHSFTAKPGQGSKLAAQMKEIATVGRLRNIRILTDVVGEFNQVLMEHEIESLAEFEEAMKRYGTDPAIQEKAKGYTDLWMNGRREVFRVV